MVLAALRLSITQKFPWAMVGISILLVMAAQVVSTGKQAFSCLFGAFCCGALAFRIRSWATSEDAEDIDSLRAELAALRISAAMSAAGAAALPPLPPPAGTQPLWDATSPTAPSGMLGALDAAVNGHNTQSPPLACRMGPVQQVPPQAADRSMLDLITRTLQAMSASSSSNPHWARGFWKWIALKIANNEIAPDLLNVLISFGYIGEDTLTTPNVTSLCQALEHGFSTTPASTQNWAAANSWGGSSGNTYHTALPGDMRRAATEIYRTIRSEGAASVRQWLRENFTGYKGPSGPWDELWSLAAQVDFALSNCQSDADMLRVLGTDDRVEIALRHLGAHFYESRTRDRAGAAQMRAFSSPGSARDIVPGWMVSEASAFSKVEHQRSERVETEIRRRSAQDKTKGDSKGKKDFKGTKGNS